MTQGHVFVVQGTIGEMVADAAVVSTDAAFSVVPHWHAVITPERPFRGAQHRPSTWSEQGWGRDRTGRPVWFLDVTAANTGGVDAFGRLRVLLADIAEAEVERQVQGRPLPLVVLPIIGTKGGGFSHQRGSVIEQLLRTCQEFVVDHAVDVAIVAQNPASFAALQNRRREDVETYFGGCDLEAARRIGRSARDGSLALFIGAGTSIPAGAPSWQRLLDDLAKEAGLSDEVQESFKDLTALDQAELLHARLGGKLGTSVQTHLQGLKPALSHVLLANLGCQGAVTTNYDRLYEDAVASSGGSTATVLPHEIPRPGNRWLLKMHGDVKDSSSIVLTRGQFVGFTAALAPAGAVLQSLLLTKHLLVVGTSMKDDNFLRLIHEVAAYRRRSHEAAQKGAASSGAQTKQDQFGTILSLEDDPARRELQAPYFHWLSMPGASISESARQLEIFLDAVAMYASGDNSWLLDERFAHLLDGRQQGLAAQVRALALDIRRQAVSSSAWTALADELDGFGARSRSTLSAPGQSVDRGRSNRRRADPTS